MNESHDYECEAAGQQMPPALRMAYGGRSHDADGPAWLASPPAGVHVGVDRQGAWLLSLRVPAPTMTVQLAAAYALSGALNIQGFGSHWVLDWRCAGQTASDQGGWLTRLEPLRDELLRGDWRCLYLGWLAGVGAGLIDDLVQEPPVPDDLSRLTAAQGALVDFLDLDRDLLTAAARTSKALSPGHQDDARAHWLATLTEPEKLVTLQLLLAGQAQTAEQQLQAGFAAWQHRQRLLAVDTAPRRRVAELRQLAASLRTEREHAAERALAAQKQEYESYLLELTAAVPMSWKIANDYASQGTAASYDKTLELLRVMAEAYQLTRQQVVFDRELADFMVRHGSRPALAKRLREAGLWAG